MLDQSSISVITLVNVVCPNKLKQFKKMKKQSFVSFYIFDGLKSKKLLYDLYENDRVKPERLIAA